MKLSKLYSNSPNIFGPISFESGLNVILAEIRVPKNKMKDTHNLGKTTLGRMIDFGFLADRDPNFFLFKHFDVFSTFVFFLEIELQIGSYLTVRRSVSEASRISFKKHGFPRQDFSKLADPDWDHSDMPFERAREMLDSLLDLRSLKPWSYRKGLGYLLRSQDDFRDVFHLRRFLGSHAEWKPSLAHTLGFDAALVEKLYEKEVKLDESEAAAQIVKNELGGTVESLSKIEGILLLKRAEAEKKQVLLDAFDFRALDRNLTKNVVEELDARIASLNAKRYTLQQARKKIISSLEEDEILFAPDEAQQLFKEVGVLFQGQIKKDFEQLIDFNRAITEERRQYLQEERTEIEVELKQLNTDINSLGRRRSDSLAHLSEADVFTKFRQVSDDLVTLKADITSLERQLSFIRRLQDLRSQIRSLTEEKAHLQSQIESNVEAQNSDSVSLFSTIRLYFSDVVEEVISRKALLSVSVNQAGHLDFKAEILDESGNASSAASGHTYKKLLCIAFDLAVLRSHLNEHFPRFVYHDGVFESLDDRKKENLILILREYADLGIQPIITLIDSDLPDREESSGPVFEESEIVLRLHDEGDSGRLFRMPSW